MTAEEEDQGRLARAVTIGLVVACAVAAVLPIFCARDFPGVDQPQHMAVVAAWNHIGDPRYGLDAYYESRVGPDPYFLYYGILHLLSAVMPLAWANKLFIAGSVLGLAGGLRAVMRAHGRAPLLALAALPLAWNYNMAAGFVSTVFGMAILFWAYAFLVRLEDARPWPRWQLYAVNVLFGVLCYLGHFIAWVIWALLALTRLRWRGALLLAPSALLFLNQGDRPKLAGGLQVDARWAGNSLKDFFETMLEYVKRGERVALLCGLAACLLLAWLLMRRDETVEDRRPWLLPALFAGLFFALPFVLNRPFYWSNINVRLSAFAFATLFCCLTPGRLPGWRGAGFAAAMLAVLVAFDARVVPRFRAYDRNSRDFHALVARLPYDPDAMTVIQFIDDPMRKALWKAQGAYIGVERGGWRAAGFQQRNFPIKARPALKQIQAQKGDDPKKYRYVITRHKKGTAPPAWAGFALVERRGEWTLWENQKALQTPQ